MRKNSREHNQSPRPGYHWPLDPDENPAIKEKDDDVRNCQEIERITRPFLDPEDEQ